MFIAKLNNSIKMELMEISTDGNPYFLEIIAKIINVLFLITMDLHTQHDELQL